MLAVQHILLTVQHIQLAVQCIATPLDIQSLFDLCHGSPCCGTRCTTSSACCSASGPNLLYNHFLLSHMFSFRRKAWKTELNLYNSLKVKLTTMLVFMTCLFFRIRCRRLAQFRLFFDLVLGDAEIRFELLYSSQRASPTT